MSECPMPCHCDFNMSNKSLMKTSLWVPIPASRLQKVLFLLVCNQIFKIKIYYYKCK